MSDHNVLTSPDSGDGALLIDQVVVQCGGFSEDVRVRAVYGQPKVYLENNSDSEIEYRVVRVSRSFYNYSKLDGYVNWKVIRDFTKEELVIESKSYAQKVPYLSHYNGDLFLVYAYVCAPLDNVSAQTWVEKDYRRLIGNAVDSGNTTVSDIFAYFCKFYMERHIRYEEYSDWDPNNNIDDMIEAIIDFLYRDKSNLDSIDLSRKQLVVDRFNVGSAGRQDAGEFKGEWDKVLHFLAGANLSDAVGNWFGYEMGFTVEQYDGIKAIYGDVMGTRKPHQVGFDWVDFAWTAAGSLFHELVADAPSHNECRNLIKAFSDGSLRISDLFSTSGISPHVGVFYPLSIPIVTSQRRLVDRALEQMKVKIEAKYLII